MRRPKPPNNEFVVPEEEEEEEEVVVVVVYRLGKDVGRSHRSLIGDTTLQVA